MGLARLFDPVSRFSSLPRQPHDAMTTTLPDTNELVNDYSDRLFRFFRSHGIAYDEAQDLTNDTFVVFLGRDPATIEKPSAFLWGVARKKLLQAKTRPRTYEEYRTSLGPDVLTSLSQRVDRDLRVQALLMQLEEDERTVFLLRCEGLTIDEIAKITDLSKATINRRLADTRTKIDELSRKSDEESFSADDVADHYREM